MQYMKRLAGWVVAGALAFAIGAANAQVVAGRDYIDVKPPQPTASGGKIEVREFFWYGCPHCNYLQAPLKAWLKKMPADVDFIRQPAAFQESWLQLARTYYAIEGMGLVDKLHHEVFAAIHDQRALDPKLLLKDGKPLFDWVASKGVDRQKFMDVYQSFAVGGRVQRTMEITKNYDIAGTPAIVVDGRYLTAPSMILRPDKSVDYDRYFRVLDVVIALARKQRGGK